MAIVESGLIINCVPLIRSEYYHSENDIDPFMKTNLFSVVQSFASQAFKDEVKEIQLKNHQVLIKVLRPSDVEQLLFYLIVEKGTDIPEVQTRISNILKKINFNEIIFDSPVMTAELKQVKEIIDEELADMVRGPAERAKIIFG
ncbi:MAG: hypothetical protein U9O98_09660 [Asgard group archaeon]|nr:hypothetical protein [Asgard group archaeon]